MHIRTSEFYDIQVIPFVVRTQYGPMSYASAYCHRLSDSDYLSLVPVLESRVTRNSGLLGGWGGEAYSGGRCKEGYGFQKPRAFWSAA